MRYTTVDESDENGTAGHDSQDERLTWHWFSTSGDWFYLEDCLSLYLISLASFRHFVFHIEAVI